MIQLLNLNLSKPERGNRKIRFTLGITMFINKLFISVIVLVFFGCNENSEYSSDPKIILKGEKLFKTYCVSCHDLKIDGIAPGLDKVTKSIDNKWLANFIKNPSAMINSGDKRAKMLYNQYKTNMPGFSFLKDDQIHAILSYIHLNSKESNANSLTENNIATSITLPKGDTIKDGNLTLSIEDLVTIPSSSDNPPLAKIANMRVRPGSANDEFYVNDLRGFIYFVKGSKVTEFFNIKNYIKDFVMTPGLGTGLGTFVFHPDFQNNKLIYTTHAEEYKGIPGDNGFGDSVKIKMQWVLTEWKMEGSNEKFNGTHRELLRINFPTYWHGFQDMNFMEGIPKNHPQYGLLYLGIGEGGSVEGGTPQLCHNLSSPLGTILRIDPLGSNSRNGRYGIPTSNPFLSSQEPGVWKEIWAYGFRNPHKLEWTSEDKLIVADVGQHSFEELNLVVPGADYGWYHREGNHRLDLTQLKAAQPMENYGTQYKLPLAQYDHYIGNAICGGYVYTGTIESLRNKYFFGDIVNGKIFYLKLPFERESLNPIYSVQLFYKGSISSMMEIAGKGGRVDLRFGKDKNKNLYIISRSDAKIRKVIGIKK
jgi:mono/diheme cytochrome c family protein